MLDWITMNDSVTSTSLSKELNVSEIRKPLFQQLPIEILQEILGWLFAMPHKAGEQSTTLEVWKVHSRFYEALPQQGKLWITYEHTKRSCYMWHHQSRCKYHPGEDIPDYHGSGLWSCCGSNSWSDSTGGGCVCIPPWTQALAEAVSEKASVAERNMQNHLKELEPDKTSEQPQLVHQSLIRKLVYPQYTPPFPSSLLTTPVRGQLNHSGEPVWISFLQPLFFRAKTGLQTHTWWGMVDDGNDGCMFGLRQHWVETTTPAVGSLDVWKEKMGKCPVLPPPDLNEKLMQKGCWLTVLGAGKAAGVEPTSKDSSVDLLGRRTMSGLY
eukprot:TRINITY_DN18529_c0_g1_i1.p1 TRINITY_DN18529_c0_g1~~TRINITY_DN18529_c0_g1_i1.p1  ORF type:complete len:325 (+),score=10.10 TRINITY_DN18529_c0_g1_i1:26-1000(+)